MGRTTFAPWAEIVLGAPFPMTAQTFQAQYGEARGYELIEGRLVWVTPAGTEHGGIEAEIVGLLRDFIRPRKLGRLFGAETGFLISQSGETDTVLAPDVAYLAAGRIPPKGSPEREGFWRVAPDLVVEVASPSQSRPELAEKARLWLGAGVRLVWIVWPGSEQVDIYHGSAVMVTASGGDHLDGDDVLPGFACAVEDIFAE